MNEEERLLRQRERLLDALYSAATRPDGWAGCLEAISSTFDGACAFRIASGPQLEDVRSAGATLDPSYVRAYYERYAGNDPLTSRDRELFAPPVVVEESLLPLDQLRRSAFFADWMSPQDLGRIMRWRVDAPSGVLDLLVLRSESVGEFTRAEQRFSQSMLPHLGRAIEISDRLRGFEARESAFQAALERNPSAVVLADGARRVRFANRRAEALFGAGEGLTVRSGHLHAIGHSDGKLGELLIRATRDTDRRSGRTGGLLALPRTLAPTPLSVAVSPLHEGSLYPGTDALALVLINDPQDKLRVPTEGLRALYDLTPAEARLLAALCTGESIADVAARTGTSITTLKTHLGAVFLKTGERRQVDVLLRVARDESLLSGGS